MKYSHYDQAKKISANLWKSHWRLRLDMFDVRSLLAVACGVFDMKVNASNIHHDSNGCGVFSGRLFGARKTVGYYYGTFAYSKLTTRLRRRFWIARERKEVHGEYQYVLAQEICLR